MSYELKPLMRQKVLYSSDNATNPLLYQLVVDGVKAAPTSATITIYRRGNTTALVGPVAMTTSGTLLTYSLDTTTVASWPLDTGYRADIVVTTDVGDYARHLVFDVVSYLLDLSIGVDQLVDLDDRVAGMVHNGSDDMPGLIASARAVIQAHIESKALKDKKLLENCILDPSHLSTCAAYFMLAQLWFEKGSEDKAKWYRKEFDDLINVVLNNMRYDGDQNGEEDAQPGGIQQVRLCT